MAKPMSPERIAEAAMLESGVAPTHKCEICGHQGLEDPVVGCLRCGWDEMTPISAASQDQEGGK